MMTLMPCSLSLFRHVNHPCLFLSLTLSLSSATLTHFTLFCFGCNLSVFLSPSLFLPHVNSHFSNMYTIPPSLSHVLPFLSLQPCSPPLFPLSLSFFLYLSPIIIISLSLSLSLSLQPCSPILLSSLVDTTSLPFLSLPLSLFSHTHTLYSLLLQIWPLSLNRHSSDTYTTPISLLLSPSPLPPSLPFINFP